VRHRQTKGAATDMFNLQQPRHTSTLPTGARPLLVYRINSPIWFCAYEIASYSRSKCRSTERITQLPSAPRRSSSSKPYTRSRDWHGKEALDTACTEIRADAASGPKNADAFMHGFDRARASRDPRRTPARVHATTSSDAIERDERSAVRCRQRGNQTCARAADNHCYTVGTIRPRNKHALAESPCSTICMPRADQCLPDCSPSLPVGYRAHLGQEG
jgi:hypothetical protein